MRNYIKATSSMSGAHSWIHPFGFIDQNVLWVAFALEISWWKISFNKYVQHVTRENFNWALFDIIHLRKASPIFPTPISKIPMQWKIIQKPNVSDVLYPKCRRLGRHAWEIAISFPAGRLFFRMARSKVAVVSTWDISSSRPRVITKKIMFGQSSGYFLGWVLTCFTNLNDTEVVIGDILVWDPTGWFQGISLLF